MDNPNGILFIQNVDFIYSIPKTEFILKFLEFHFWFRVFYLREPLTQATYIRDVYLRNNNKDLFPTKIEMPKTCSTTNILRGKFNVQNKLENLYGKTE